MRKNDRAEGGDTEVITRHEIQGGPIGNKLSAVVISGEDQRRRTLVAALTAQQVAIAEEFKDYPGLDSFLNRAAGCDVALIDLYPDAETALSLVENLCGKDPAITVMVFSRGDDPAQVVRCMRAGAREFLTEATLAETLGEALVRAAARRLESPRTKRTAGKLLVFVGVKGGSGVTTLASNFAIALRQESEKETALLDMNLHLGDVPVLLGLTPEYTVLDALRSGARLDAELLSKLVAGHETGLAVLAGPDEYQADVEAESGNVRKLVHFMRERFAYVVADGGLGVANSEALLESADIIYLVIQSDILSLRNAQRIIAHLSRRGAGGKVEVVANRFEPRKTEVTEEDITKALSVPLKWKIPNDYARARRSHDTGAPVALQTSALSEAMHEMARTACGKVLDAKKRKKFGLFG